MTIEPDLIKNSDGTFSVFTAPVSAAGAFVAVAPDQATALQIINDLRDHYGLVKDIAGQWRLRSFHGRSDFTGRHVSTFASPNDAHKWVAENWRRTRKAGR